MFEPHHSNNCGVEHSTVPDIQACISEATLNNYSFVVIPIVHPRFKRHFVSGKNFFPGFTRSDILLAPDDWHLKVVGKISPYLDVDSPSSIVRQQHELCLNQELTFCKGLGIPAIMINLYGVRTCNLARLLLTQFDSINQSTMIWARVPMFCNKTLRANTNENDEVLDEDAPYNETWRWWSRFHELMEWDKRVGVVLEMSADLPSQAILNRWIGEPVKAIVLPTSLFPLNKRGYPVLPRAHQHIVNGFVERDAQIIISGAERSNTMNYSQYLRVIYEKKNNLNNDPMLAYARGWEDYLQTPLQPLADNLDTHTYNVFEKDPVKYDQYQSAIVQALNDLRKKYIDDGNVQTENKEEINESNENQPAVECKNGSDVVTKNKNAGDQTAVECKTECDVEIKNEIDNEAINENDIAKIEKINENLTQTNNENSVGTKLNDSTCETIECKKVFTVMVLGAGRGPLIKATLNASDITGVKVKVVAVEKNPCAMVTLVTLARDVWGDRDVTVVPGDMRNVNLSPPADIIVSELLGSWADNELSPECLDGAAGLLRPGGISIPQSYTSYAAPITSPRLWAAAKAVAGTTFNHNPEKNLETLWVVYMQNKYDIADTKPIFTFTHPAKGVVDNEGEEVKDSSGLPVTDNSRTATVTWTAQQDSVMHGFGGYFDCVLYGDKTLSIVPSTHSPGMISWFPVFIPIKTPIRVQKGEKIEATFWRCVNPRRVWYEWIVNVGHRSTPIHNSNGRSSEMLL